MAKETQPGAAARKLRKHITDLGITDAEAASQVGISAPTMCRYLRGEFVPKNAVRLAIERWTKRKIKRDEWDSAELEKADAAAAGGR